jgi:hypothetical protein
MNREFLTVAFVLVFACPLFAQQRCETWPADCPEKESMELSQSDAHRLEAGLLQSEIAIQDKMRNEITTLFQHTATSLHWQVTQLEDITGLSGRQKPETPASLRSPRGMEMYFQFIVSDDSLESWRNWKLSDIENRKTVGTAATNSYGDVLNSPLYKSYIDSANHYQQLYTDYMEKHQNEGAALFTDKTAESYSKKMNAYTDKAVALQKQNINGNGFKSLEEEGKKINYRYRNATVVYVDVTQNYDVVQIHDDANKASPYSFPGAAIARQAVIKEEESGYYHEFGKWNYMVMLLFGSWSAKTVNGSYLAGFSANGQNDDHTAKKVPSDKTQTISVSVFGNQRNVEKFVQALHSANLQQLIDR